MDIRQSKRKKTSIKNHHSQEDVRLSRSKQRFSDTCTPSRFHKHPYATRSKSLREMSSTNNKFENLSNRSSDSSIIFLGSFHKIPQLITLDDNDGEDDKVTEHLDTKKQDVNIFY
ncbi:putative crossover junction endonuclease mus81 [Vespula squamosa]|uniref:Crossover junction endonuclease mus81 n=1 Tax=Vespula squamosa TaxID=30214 RepID=A0ABD2BVY4_VESSQ